MVPARAVPVSSVKPEKPAYFFWFNAQGTLWHDLNANGIKEAGEPGVTTGVGQLAGGTNLIGGIWNIGTLGLTNGSPAFTTNENSSSPGFWSRSLVEGTYYVHYNLPAGFAKFSPQLTGTGGSDPTAGRSSVNSDGNSGSYGTFLIFGTQTRTFDAGVYRYAKLGSKVWIDKNNNGIMDGGEPGAGGAVVRLYNNNGSVIATTTTDGNGNYQFEGLMPGQNYSVGVVMPANTAIGATTATSNDPNNNNVTDNNGVTLSGNEVRTNKIYLTNTQETDGANRDDNFTLNVGLKAVGFDVSGKVFNDVNGATAGADGTPLSGVPVQLKDLSTGGILTVNTDPTGSYLFSAVPVGNYEVIVPQYGNYQNVSTSESPSATDGRITVAVNNAPVANQNFGLGQPPVTVNDSKTGVTPGTPATVTVLTNDTDPNGNINNGSVNLVPPAGATGTDTDGDGDIDKVVVPNQGTWTVDNTGTVTFTPQTGFTGNPTPITYTIKDNSGLVSNPATITVTYLSAYSIAGKVFNDVNGATNGADGTAMSNVSVQLKNGTGTVIGTVTTDNTGAYVFNNIVAGNYTVTVVPGTGYQNVSSSESPSQTDGVIPVTVSNANITNQNFGLGQPPVTVNDSKTGITPGTPATVTVLTNDTDPNNNINTGSVNFVTPNGATGTDTDGDGDIDKVVVPNQGTWTVDNTGTVTFTPQTGFTGGPTPITYTIKDNSGLVSNPSTITVSYLAGFSIAGKVFNDVNGSTNGADGTAMSNVSVQLKNGTGTVIGTVTTDNTGAYVFNNVVAGNYTVTVVPGTGYQNVSSSESPSQTDGVIPVTVSNANIANQNFGLGQPPVTVNDSKTGVTPGTPATVTVLTNDTDPNNNINTGSVNFVPPTGATGTDTDGDGNIDKVVVPNEGTWTVDNTGTVTFTPQAGFTGNPTPLSYTIKDNSGLVSNPSTITITYLALPDLTPSIMVVPTQVTGTKNLSVRVVVREVLNTATQTDKAIYVFIPTATHYTIGAFDPALSSVAGLPVQNKDWTYTGVQGSNYVFKLGGTTGKKIIDAGGTSAFGFTVVFDPKKTGGKDAMVVSVFDGSGGEINFKNNKDNDVIKYGF